MLTNLHYYGHYRKYATQNRVRQIPRTAQWVTIGRKSEIAITAKNTSFMLNTAYKNETITFARQLSRNIVGLKESAKMFVYDAIGHSYGDNYWHWIEEDIENFVRSYNALRRIARHTGHSAILADFTGQMDRHTDENRDSILKLGMKINNHRELEFPGQVPKNLREQNMKKSLEIITDFFKKSYTKTTDLLKHPLGKHMNFTSLDFYYNYRISNNGGSPLIQLESGILLDVKT